MAEHESCTGKSDEWYTPREIFAPRAEAILFPQGKTRFVPSEETRARLEMEAKKRNPENGKFNNAPGHGVVLIGMGDTACEALHKSKLGMVWDRRVGQGLSLSRPNGGSHD